MKLLDKAERRRAQAAPLALGIDEKAALLRPGDVITVCAYRILQAASGTFEPVGRRAGRSCSCPHASPEHLKLISVLAPGDISFAQLPALCGQRSVVTASLSGCVFSAPALAVVTHSTLRLASTPILKFSAPGAGSSSAHELPSISQSSLDALQPYNALHGDASDPKKLLLFTTSTSTPTLLRFEARARDVSCCPVPRLSLFSV